LRQETGPDWKEANLTIQQIMNYYAGVDVRSETLLTAGLTHFNRLRDMVLNRMVADNAHNLMRCTEVLDLLECGEAIFLTAPERKETRAMHKRKDFPFTNPLLAEKLLTIRSENGRPVLEWRDKF
jgi:succinate dehydrogenase/fumarate reductase flavoprotein subunit